MTFSGEIWILNKVAELAQRCGVSPTVANVELKLHFPEKGAYYYSLSMVEGEPDTPEELEKLERVRSLLGLEQETFREFRNLSDVEKIVNHALSLAPRARIRER